jgi:hypothetical protein
MSREKLRQPGTDLPLFTTTAVTSFPKPDSLIQARADFAKKQISRDGLDEKARQATLFRVRKQEELDVDVPRIGERNPARSEGSGPGQGPNRAD